MKLFMAALLTETNTFSPLPTGREAFLGNGFSRNAGSAAPPFWGNIPLITWRRLAAEAGMEVIESLTANAQPGGTTVRAAYEELRELILADLRAAQPTDIVLLNLHGAMVAEGYDDCESDLVRRVREIVGPNAVIGVELDLHCHLDEVLRENADLIVIYKEYPHVDMAERAEDLFRLALRTAQREIRPVIAYHPLPMINMWHTPVEPMRSFVADMLGAEARGEILSLSFAHGFPWGDVPHLGARVVAIADGDADHAARTAEAWGARLWAMREVTQKRFDTPDQSIDAALAVPSGTTVVAETSDNAGGGAPSDCTAMLARMLARGVRDAAIGMFWDPIAVSFLREAGAGATLPLRLGGKCGPMSGDPLDLLVRVHAVTDRHVQSGLSGGRSEMGPSAWIEAQSGDGGIHIIVASERQQVFHPDAFTGLGCTLHDKRLVVVKSSQHFYAGFAPLAREVRYCAAEAGILRDFAAIPYRRFTGRYWPKVENP
ncbi:M81 family metallopeptidase [Roseococcus sp. SDR]|uniref:M81 family metallopeptidase n=1 Tax=Roseococcus sp. SDR TaxID=2835532 RepID=UPI001BD18A57|nr:M81 family metallopeptidase [Roseococcus sp. SDR]MBS7789587.1 M81 family metallopeptidase [Roseococcus sp. SDR]MBV1844901.1 M81 family metallopeptidase [Roseococcus sp. SDR]